MCIYCRLSAPLNWPNVKQCRHCQNIDKQKKYELLCPPFLPQKTHCSEKIIQNEFYIPKIVADERLPERMLYIYSITNLKTTNKLVIMIFSVLV
jgi:hypothetical protein